VSLSPAPAYMGLSGVLYETQHTAAGKAEKHARQLKTLKVKMNKLSFLTPIKWKDAWNDLLNNT